VRISRRHDAKDRILSLSEFQRRLEAMNELIADLKVEVNFMHQQVGVEMERQQNVIVEEEGKK
jgi:hypothetical protein